MATPNYAVNYEDERFKEVTNEKNAALSENEQLYDNMIAEGKQFYENQAAELEKQKEIQTEEINKQTDFAIEQIEQNKAQANKDYLKEQSGAYVDWQKEKDSYGVNAEKRASAGLAGSGYSESQQASLYTAYQNRLATARESYNQSVLNYNNSIKEAQLQNSSLLAELALNTLQQQLEISLAGFQYNNELLREKQNQKLQLTSYYDSKWQNVLAQINNENAMAEQVRQFNEQMALDRARASSNSRTENTNGLGAALRGLLGEVVNEVDSYNDKFSWKNAFSKKSANSSFEGASKSDAISYMKKNGVSSDIYNKVLSQSEFDMAKVTGKSGYGQYKTYKDYLKGYIDYYIG